MINKVARTLGIEVGKDFIAKNLKGNLGRYRLNKDGRLLRYDTNRFSYYDHGYEIYLLITGELKVISTPNNRDFYYIPCPSKKELYYTFQWDNSEADMMLYMRNLVYMNKSEAIKTAEKMLENLGGINDDK